MAMKRPWPSRSCSSRRAWPPAPNVQSTTVSPGRTARSSRTSPASPGTGGSRPRVGKAFGNNLGAPFHLRELAAPGLTVPDLEPVAQTGDDDVLDQARVAHQRSRQRHTAGTVELALLGCAEQVALQAA